MADASALLKCVQDCISFEGLPNDDACLEGCYKPLADEHLSAEAQFDTGLPPWVAITIVGFILIPLSGLFSGLTLGLLSLDVVSLKVIEQAGDLEERKHARRIIPVRRKGNRLLCTLLLGNTVINSAISILLSALTSGAVGLVVSTFVILIAGEIAPQSICSRHGLKIGARSVWLVDIFMFLFAPITWPISLVLDWLLGRDIGTVYSQEELKRLIELHVLDPDAQRESGLTFEDHKLLMGAFSYKDKRVRDVMTQLDQVFMLEKGLHLDFQVMLDIYKSGFTRIPVYQAEKTNIIGILYTKDLLLVDPEDDLELGAVLSFRGRCVGRIADSEKLDSVLSKFMGSAASSHMMIAHAGGGGGAPLGSVTGLITLEDVIEELLQAEIVDETDTFVDVNARLPRKVAKGAQALNHLVTLYENRFKGDSAKLGGPEVQAIAAFLSNNVPEIAPLARSEAALKALIRQSEVMTHEGASAESDSPHTSSLSSSPGTSATGGGGDLHRAFSWTSAKQRGLQLYQRGVVSHTFTLILQGKVMIRTGCEDFQLELGPWSVLGNSALSLEAYTPDFDAVGLAPVRVLRLHRDTYVAAIEALRVEALLGSRAVRASMLPSLRSAPQLAPVPDSAASDCSGGGGGGMLAAALSTSSSPSDGGLRGGSPTSTGAGPSAAAPLAVYDLQPPPALPRSPPLPLAIRPRGQEEEPPVAPDEDQHIAGLGLLREAASRPVGLMGRLRGPVGTSFFSPNAAAAGGGGGGDVETGAYFTVDSDGEELLLDADEAPSKRLPRRSSSVHWA